MTPDSVRRGYDPDDARLFADESLPLMRTAQEEIRWLLNRGYPMGSVTELVGSHHQLAARQRTALQRSTASDRQLAGRESTRLPLQAAFQQTLLIDGFNLIILLEVALSGSLLVLGQDDVLRDLAGLRGTYRIVAQTERAVDLIGHSLSSLGVSDTVFYLDENVSNSGRLRHLILERAGSWPMTVRVDLVSNADSCLYRQERIVTGDSFVLDTCRSWFNLARQIVSESIPQGWIFRLDGT